MAGAEGEAPAEAPATRDALDGLNEVERLGLAGLRLRETAEFRQAKDSRPRQGEDWNMEGCTSVVPTPRSAPSVGARSGGPTSATSRARSPSASSSCRGRPPR